MEDCKRRPQGADRILSTAARQPHRRLGLVHAQPVRGVLHRVGQAPVFVEPLSAPPEAGLLSLPANEAMRLAAEVTLVVARGLGVRENSREGEVQASDQGAGRCRSEES